MSDFDFAEVLTRMVQMRASDVHLTPGFQPAVRVRGQIRRSRTCPLLTPQQTREIVYSILNDAQRKHFENHLQLDFAYAIPNVARFRVNCFFQRGAISAAFRHIPQEIQTLRGARPAGGARGVHPQAARLRPRHRPDRLRQDDLAGGDDRHDQPRARGAHPHDRGPDRVPAPAHKCIVNQREIGSDATDFALALKSALREDPDVILVGEMRDLETISTALTAAETGHLVFATLHTQSTAQTVDRIIDVFPAEQQQQVRMQLSIALQGIVTQQLLPTADGSGRVCRLRGAGPDPGDPQPDPRGQDPPDLLGDPDLRRDRDADDGRPPRPARPPGADHRQARRAAGLGARGAESACSAAAASNGASAQQYQGAATTLGHRPDRIMEAGR